MYGVFRLEIVVFGSVDKGNDLQNKPAHLLVMMTVGIDVVVIF